MQELPYKSFHLQLNQHVTMLRIYQVNEAVELRIFGLIVGVLSIPCPE